MIQYIGKNEQVFPCSIQVVTYEYTSVRIKIELFGFKNPCLIFIRVQANGNYYYLLKVFHFEIEN